MIARNIPGHAAIPKEQFAEVLEARARDKKALAEALARVRELELPAAAALELRREGGRPAGLEGPGLPREDLAGKDLAMGLLRSATRPSCAC